MSNARAVWIAHVPYQVRGGEDVQVEYLADAYRAAGLNPVLLPADRTPPRITLSEAWRSLDVEGDTADFDRLARESPPAFVHLHNPYPLLGPRFLAWCVRRGVRVVQTVHNHRFYCPSGLAFRDGRVCKECLPRSRPWGALRHNCAGDWKKSAYYFLGVSAMRDRDLLLRAVGTFVAPSPYIAGELERFGVPRERISVIYNPVIAGESPTPAVARKWDVLFASRLSHEKGVAVLRQAAASLTELKVAIAGEGPEMRAVQEAAARLPNVTYLGKLGHEGVLQALAESRVAVLPSVWNEILPGFALEAFFAGRRCVVSSVESMRWFAEDPFFGVLARPGDPEDLARSIRRAISMGDPEAGQVTRLREIFSRERYHASIGRLAAEVSA